MLHVQCRILCCIMILEIKAGTFRLPVSITLINKAVTHVPLHKQVQRRCKDLLTQHS